MRNYKVLFLCTGNCARSIMAEHLINRFSHGSFQGFSAGAKPTGEVHPMALQVLKEVYHTDASQSRPKFWDEYIRAEMEFDFIITLCDKAREVCPVFSGHPITAHWGSPNPADFEGTEAEKYAFFVKVAMQIQRRIELFCSLPFEKLDRLRLQEVTTDIGQQEKL